MGSADGGNVVEKRSRRPLKVECVEEGLSKRHLDIELPVEQVSEAYEKEVRRLGKKIKIPGFRKGKIPKDMIRTRFRGDILNQVAQDLVPQALQKALNEKSLNPIGEPQIENLEIDAEQPLRFRASFDVMPKIEVDDFKGLEVTERETKVGEEEIDKRLDSLRERAARFDPVEGRGARDGDFIMGTVQEQPVAGGPPQRQEGALIEVGTGAYHPALDEKLQGANTGDELSLQVTFPADHRDQEKAGKTYDVNVEVKEIKEKILPELDDELAKDLGEFENMEALRSHVREQAEVEAKAGDQQHLRNQLLEKLLEANSFDAPETLIEHELDGRVEELARSFIDRGLDPNGSGIDWRDVRERQREAATQSVKATILLDRIIEQEGIKETEQEVDDEVERIATEVKKKTDVVRAQLMKEGGLERLRRRIKRDKAFDLLRQSAKIKRG
jgi:trigger factor